MTRGPVVLRAGIDVGSTTVKLAILDAEDRLLCGSYERHKADIRGTLIAVIEAAHDALAARGQDRDLRVAVTGSGGLSVSQWLELPFIQEVIAGSRAVRQFLPDTDVAIELGGEDAKITYFAGGLEQRMNGTCAGGTGAFIDQMASLLSTDAAGLNELARSHETIYPIAARCGVFAKTDVQPLINEGARREDIAASILQAVVNQTISGLACGKPSAAQRLCDEWTARCRAAIARPGFRRYRRTIQAMVRDFDSLPQKGARKPRVGVVGEILVKFHPTANNGIVEMIESESAEAVVPDLADFLLYASHGSQFRRRRLAGSLGNALLSHAAIAGIELLRRPQKRALARSSRFNPPHSIYTLARGVDGIVQLGNVTGEGWFLTAEMVELMKEGVTAIACIQPFACLPNHVTGKGMIRELRKRHPEATIAAIDYDPGASEVNQVNRLKLLLAAAREAHAGKEERP